ncbi:Avirulence protein [Phytophthora megakarya]|uniref:Avirulence protein n=1 Tax=Phytophthora megakarya TaxID=4795 RepID=A0A225WMY4_9STRA|nr:Avirulence protein [Phytophthora megakarya]
MEASEHVDSPRESVVSAIDEELMNRPTDELFDMIRANRPMFSGDGSRSSMGMHDLEASHMRRMDELNRIAVDHLGNRISNFDDDMLGSAFKPGRSMHPGFRDEEKEMQWRSTRVMEEVQSKHQVDMERLRRRIRQLEEECRESIASVLTPEEMDLSELDSDDEQPNKFNGSRNFNPQSSFMCASDLSASTMSERNSADDDEVQEAPLPAQILFQRIQQLTLLQQEMAEVEDDDDEDEYRDRIKEQYRVLQSIKANGAREDRESLSSRQSMQKRESQERESLDDDSLWI